MVPRLHITLKLNVMDQKVHTETQREHRGHRDLKVFSVLSVCPLCLYVKADCRHPQLNRNHATR